jgi:hypothetical protein
MKFFGYTLSFGKYREPKLPSLQEIVAKELYDARLALLEANNDLERARGTKAMLERRVERLQKGLNEPNV